MDQTEEPQTPRRIYYKANICVLCRFAFVQAEVTSTGETIEKKLVNKKLKLTLVTEEKISAIRNVEELQKEIKTSRTLGPWSDRNTSWQPHPQLRPKLKRD